MDLAITFDEKIYDLDVPLDLIVDAQEFYTKMNSDMDNGWQVSREWIKKPNIEQRCQIVADKILEAFHHENEKTILILAGYLLSHLPDVKQVNIDTSGDITQTQFSL